MELSDHSWKGIYLMGSLFTGFSLFLILLDLVAGIITGGDFSTLPVSAKETFLQLQDSPYLGLYYLDLLNLMTQVLLIPVFFSLYATLRKHTRGEAFFAFIIFLVGSAVFISANPALPMFELSSRWMDTNNEIKRHLYESAGESILAKGAHGSLGALTGFLLSSLSGILMSIAMISGRVFNRNTALFGIAGYSFMTLYFLFVTFLPSLGKYALIAAAPGGLLVIAWFSLVGLRLLRLSKSKSGAAVPFSKKRQPAKV